MSEEKAPLNVYDLLMIMLDQTAGVAWQKLGLQHDMITGKLEPDLVQAKVAIDVTAHLVQQIEGQLDAEDKRRVQSLVRDLRINYVQRQQDTAETTA
ncbi:MAG TPA: DUF1844 domain-containing protein [Fimbriimonas sp.]|nr:DUF1844 domain-containing protein [Fimbriimonas sp.]